MVLYPVSIASLPYGTLLFSFLFVCVKFFWGVISLLLPFYFPPPLPQFFFGFSGSLLDGLRNYFSQFGKVDACTIMRDPAGRSRGFAFLTFEDPAAVNAVMVREHYLDGKIVGSFFLSFLSFHSPSRPCRRHSPSSFPCHPLFSILHSPSRLWAFDLSLISSF